MAEVGYKKVRVSREMVRREQSFEEDVRDEASLVDIFSRGIYHHYQIILIYPERQ